MSLKDLGKVKDSFMIPLTKLSEDQNNPREDFSCVPDLALSIHKMGQLTPAEVRLSDDGDSAVITDGACRFRAVQYCNNKLGDKFITLQCVAEPKGTDPASRLLRQLEHNNSVAPLKPIEKAKAYRVLRDLHGLSVAEIARRCGKTATSIADCIKILEAPEEIAEAVRDGSMSASAAIKATKSKSRDKVVAKLRERKAGGAKGKMKVSDVETETDGHSSMISANEIKRMIKKAKDYQYAARQGSKEQSRWEGAVFGLECVLKMHEF